MEPEGELILSAVIAYYGIMAVTRRELNLAVNDLSLAGTPIMVHASLRSFAEPVEGGVDGVLDVLLANACTVLTPTFTESHFGVPPPSHMRPARNGVNYTELSNQSVGPTMRIFTVHCGLIDASMGILPTRLLDRPGVLRGHHPLDSFAALGPHAEELVATQSPTDVYAPLRALTELGGSVLLLGVGLNRMTLLHLAEQRAGRRLSVRWARGTNGRVIAVETGSCSEGFPRLQTYLDMYARKTTVSRSTWAVYPAREVVEVAARVIAADPKLTRCADSDCIRCPDSIGGGPIGTIALG